jgi:hypothetical protein
MRSMVLPEPDKMSGAAPAYVRHKPEQTLLYQLVEQYWPEFQTQLSETGRFLPRHVTREFEDYLACGRLEEGLAPNSRYRDRVTPVSSGKVKKPAADADAEADGRQEPDLTASKRKGMCWAQRLKRVFNIDVSICSACGGPMKIIASIEDPFVIGKILSHLEAMFGSQGPENRRPGARAPPPAFC